MSLGLAHTTHNGWVFLEAMDQSVPADSHHPPAFLFKPVPSSYLYAPGAYRVTISILGDFVRRHTHQPAADVAAEFDFVFVFAALCLLYGLVVDRYPPGHTSLKSRLPAIAVYLFFSELALNWVVVLQRPETLPCAVFLAAGLLCLQRAGGSATWTMALLAAALWQGFTRADVAVVFGIGIIVAALWGGSVEPPKVRYGLLWKGAAVAVIGASSQAYLQFVKYPHLTYTPGTSVLQLTANLRRHNVFDFLIAVLPFAIALVYCLRKPAELAITDRVIAAASLIYLPLWFAVGSFNEVRIYVPFMLLIGAMVARTGPNIFFRAERDLKAEAIFCSKD